MSDRPYFPPSTPETAEDWPTDVWAARSTPAGLAYMNHALHCGACVGIDEPGCQPGAMLYLSMRAELGARVAAACARHDAHLGRVRNDFGATYPTPENLPRGKVTVTE